MKKAYFQEYDDDLDNLEFCGISSNDELLALDNGNNALLLWG